MDQPTKPQPTKSPTDPLMLGLLERQDQHEKQIKQMTPDFIRGMIKAEVARAFEEHMVSIKALIDGQKPKHRTVTAHLPSGPVTMEVKEHQ